MDKDPYLGCLDNRIKITVTASPHAPKITTRNHGNSISENTEQKHISRNLHCIFNFHLLCHKNSKVLKTYRRIFGYINVKVL